MGGEGREDRTHVTKFLLEGIGVFYPLSLYFSFFFQVKCKVIYNILVSLFQCIEKRLGKKGGI